MNIFIDEITFFIESIITATWAFGVNGSTRNADTNVNTRTKTREDLKVEFIILLLLLASSFETDKNIDSSKAF